MVTRSKLGIFKSKVFLTKAVADVPEDIHQAMSSNVWKGAVMKELHALIQKGTWEVTTLPLNRIPIGCKWLFKVKQNSDGSIARYKARLVAKGFHTRLGLTIQRHLVLLLRP
ncbi:hypothetical protein HRI_001756300 [Hibiscus trionum]|uniref:Reverse transcriptase Ty1/copia-type domain-containing protein n=1 Tax=Hibiscus trionum TaxID=183268 RepID=A0A9W7LZS1_HIBTR|nr:hypothetical protein HRI_001756300 [Hibiscus trionum]